MELRLVPNSREYWDFIRNLRNLNVGFKEQVSISVEQQDSYMAKYGKNYYIALLGDVPVGFVGAVDDDIRLATDPLHRRSGVGEFMIMEIVKIFPNASAKVLAGNNSSRGLFEKCGFTESFRIYEKNN